MTLYMNILHVNLSEGSLKWEELSCVDILNQKQRITEEAIQLVALEYLKEYFTI